MSFTSVQVGGGAIVLPRPLLPFSLKGENQSKGKVVALFIFVSVFCGRGLGPSQAFWLLVQCSFHHLWLMVNLYAQPGLTVVPWLTQIIKDTEVKNWTGWSDWFSGLYLSPWPIHSPTKLLNTFFFFSYFPSWHVLLACYHSSKSCPFQNPPPQELHLD